MHRFFSSFKSYVRMLINTLLFSPLRKDALIGILTKIELHRRFLLHINNSAPVATTQSRRIKNQPDLMYSSSGDLFAFFDIHQNQGMPLWSLCALHKDILTSIPQEPSTLTIPITSGPPETAVLIPTAPLCHQHSHCSLL